MIIIINANGFAVKGTLNLLLRGDTTIEQTEEIVNMWIELTAKKFYAEGVLDGLKRNKAIPQIQINNILDALESHDDDMLLRKANQLKGTDGEGWAIGEMVERVVSIKRAQGSVKIAYDRLKDMGIDSY